MALKTESEFLEHKKEHEEETIHERLMATQGSHMLRETAVLKLRWNKAKSEAIKKRHEKEYQALIIPRGRKTATEDDRDAFELHNDLVRSRDPAE